MLLHRLDITSDDDDDDDSVIVNNIMRNGDGNSIVVVAEPSILSFILSYIPPNHHTLPHFTNKPHRLYRLYHHFNEI